MLGATLSVGSVLVRLVGLAQVVLYPAQQVHMDRAVTLHVDVLTTPHVTLSGAPASVCQAGRECTVMSHVLMGECG